MNFQEQWRKLLLPLRYGGSGVDFKKLDPARSPFLKDRDRIIYSSSFRRLARKTQVHPLVRNDHIHTRLSHSLEVSSVGRSLGAMAGYFLRRRGELPDYAAPEFPGQILEAACLAHDIGNPPFGHAGEFAIRDWFGDPANHTYVNALEETQQSDFRCFDGNAQGFRVVNVVENNRDQGGFRLTYPTLASMVKYPWDSWQSRARGGKCKFNYYQAEAAIFEDVFRALGLKTRRGDFARHPLSLLAEAADDTCYRIVDMEDARELDIITLADILKVVEPLAPSLELDPQRLDHMGSDRERAGYVRARVIGHVTAVRAHHAPGIRGPAHGHGAGRRTGLYGQGQGDLQRAHPQEQPQDSTGDRLLQRLQAPAGYLHPGLPSPHLRSRTAHLQGAAGPAAHGRPCAAPGG